MRASRSLRVLLVSGVLLLPTLAACTSDAPEELSEVTRLDPVPRPATSNPDRDQPQASRLAAALDPCVLASTGRRGPLALVAVSPHDCRVTSRDGSGRVNVRTGMELTEDARFYLPRTTVAGAVAYTSHGGAGSCTWYLPTDQSSVIEVSSPGGEDCDVAERTTGRVVEQLTSDPTEAFAPASPRLIGACDLVGTARTPVAGDVVQRSLGGSDVLADSCSVRAADAEGAGPTLAVRLDHSPRSSLTRPGAGERATRVAGRPATVSTAGGVCAVNALGWPAVGRGTRGLHVVVRVVTPEPCRQAVSATRTILSHVADTDVENPTPGDGWLLYPEDEPDVPAVEECADIFAQAARTCAPLADADVPERPEALVSEAEADPAVLCHAVAPLVTEHFGAEVAPATGTVTSTLAGDADAAETAEPLAACLFGEPTHALHLVVTASTAPATSQQDWADTTRVQLGGHTATWATRNGLGDPHARIAVIALGKPSEPGHLRIQLDLTPTRGDGLLSDQRDTSLLDPARDFADDVAATLLGG